MADSGIRAAHYQRISAATTNITSPSCSKTAFEVALKLAIVRLQLPELIGDSKTLLAIGITIVDVRKRASAAAVACAFCCGIALKVVGVAVV